MKNLKHTFWNYELKSEMGCLTRHGHYLSDYLDVLNHQAFFIQLNTNKLCSIPEEDLEYFLSFFDLVDDIS